jgi:LysR family glycine cleavage system transcriptional activator
MDVRILHNSIMRIPSLQTLRALEAAARNGSYSRAAAELGLTHGAVSHRLRALEDQIGYALFVREGNGMHPTPDALRLLIPVRQALDLLATAFPDRATASRLLRVSLLPSMASRWLMPRVGRFRASNPDIDLRIDARLEFAPLTPGGADCAVRYGLGDWPGLHVAHLGDEVLFPVCTPDYRDRLAIRDPSDLMRATLLRHDRQLWRSWLDAAGLDAPEPVAGALFSDTNLLLDAAIAGEGVALARGRIVAGDLASGRLIRLFDAEVPDRYGYYVVRPLRIEPRRLRAIDSFVQWVRAEFEAAN